MCFYLRQVNQTLVLDKYPISTIEEFVPEFYRETLFNNMDLRQGIYLQIPLVDDCKNITASSSQEGVTPFRSVQFEIASPSARNYETVTVRSKRFCRVAG